MPFDQKRKKKTSKIKQSKIYVYVKKILIGQKAIKDKVNLFHPISSFQICLLLTVVASSPREYYTYIFIFASVYVKL